MWNCSAERRAAASMTSQMAATSKRGFVTMTGRWYSRTITPAPAIPKRTLFTRVFSCQPSRLWQHPLIICGVGHGTAETLGKPYTRLDATECRADLHELHHGHVVTSLHEFNLAAMLRQHFSLHVHRGSDVHVVLRLEI